VSTGSTNTGYGAAEFLSNSQRSTAYITEVK